MIHCYELSPGWPDRKQIGSQTKHDAAMGASRQQGSTVIVLEKSSSFETSSFAVLRHGDVLEMGLTEGSHN